MPLDVPLAVLIGGQGTNLQALIDFRVEGHPLPLAVVISHRPDVHGLIRAQQAKIPTEVVDHKHYPNRTEFEKALIGVIQRYEVQGVVLAGFMRVLSPYLIQEYAHKILNIHPALLPAYRGLHTHARVLKAKERESGATVHFVTEALDEGPLVAYTKVPVYPYDTEEMLQTRVLQAEHHLYPQVVAWYAQKRLVCQKETVFLDGSPLGPQGMALPLATSAKSTYT